MLLWWLLDVFSGVWSVQAERHGGNVLRVGWIWSEPFVGNGTSEPGIYVSLFDMIGNITGIEVVYEDFDDAFNEEFVKNGSLLGARAALVAGRIDAVIGRIYVNVSGLEVVHGPSVYDDDFIYIVRKPRKLHVFRNLFRGFSHGLWAAIILIFSGVAAVYGISLRLLERVKIIDTVFAVFAICLNASTPRMPKRMASKLFLASFMLYSLNMATIYLGALSDTYTVSATEPRISDFEQLYLNNVSLKITHYQERILKMKYHMRVNPKFQKQVTFCTTRDMDLIKFVAHHQDGGIGAFFSTYHSMLAEAQVVDTFFMSQFTRTTMHSTFWLRKAHPKQSLISFWALEITEKGFMLKFWRDYTLHTFNYTLMRSALVKPPRQPLGLKHYEETFYILLGGHLLSISVFLLEYPARKIEQQILWMERNSRF